MCEQKTALSMVVLFSVLPCLAIADECLSPIVSSDFFKDRWDLPGNTEVAEIGNARTLQIKRSPVWDSGAKVEITSSRLVRSKPPFAYAIHSKISKDV